MALERLPRSIRFAVRVDVQHDPHDVAPIGAFRIRIRIRIEQAHGGDRMLLVVDSARGIGGR